MTRSLFDSSANKTIRMLCFAFMMWPATVHAEDDDQNSDQAAVQFAFEKAPKHSALSPTQQHYRYRVSLALVGWDSAEVIADRRLLQFELREEGKRRVWRCVHPDAPSKQPTDRIKRVSEDAKGPFWQEWVDLRMYCSGRARRVLEQGGSLTPLYGWRRKKKDRWLARSSADTEKTLFHFEAPTVEVPAAPKGEESGPVQLSMRSTDRRFGPGLSAVLTLGTTDSNRYVYVRPDLFSFEIRHGHEQVQCGVERVVVNPIRDFFRRLGARRRVVQHLDFDQFCKTALDAPGIYEITPVIELPYDGQRFELDTLTGTFKGEPAVVRIRKGRGAYQEQLLPSATRSDQGTATQPAQNTP